MASNHAMFASEMVDKSTVVGAGDGNPADLTFADGPNVAVIPDSPAELADVARLPAMLSAVGEALSGYWPQRKWLRA